MNLEEHVVESTSGEYSRKVWLLKTSQPAARMGIFLDGEFYVNKVEAPAFLGELQQRGAIPPMNCAFVSHLDGAARHHDLTCNPRFSDFIATDLVRWMRKQDGRLAEEGHLIAGASLGGLTSAYLTITRPALFPYCLSQSGSFWWNDEWLGNSLDSAPAGKGRFWLSVGDKETAHGVSHPPTGLRQEVDQISACERLVAALNQHGHAVRYNLYAGGHECARWNEELPAAFPWLLA